MGRRKKTKIVNLTPHPVDILCGNNRLVSIKPSGDVARVEVEMNHALDLNVKGIEGTVPVYDAVAGCVVGLPEPKKGTIFIVSTMVAEIVRRRDVVSPRRLREDENKRVLAMYKSNEW